MSTYRVGVSRDLPARHFLVGGDFGPEGELHGHEYRVEVVVESERLGESGFVVDIVKVEDALDGLVARYRGAVLNELPEFAGANPSIEVFARVVLDAMADALRDVGLTAVEARIWESATAWASCRKEM